MYQRRVLPQLPSLPAMPAAQVPSIRTPPQMIPPAQQGKGGGMPQVPVGLLSEMLKGSPQVTEGFLGAGLGPSAFDSAAASVFPETAFATPYLDSLIATGQGGSLMDALGAGGAFSMGTGDVLAPAALGGEAAGGGLLGGLLGGGEAAAGAGALGEGALGAGALGGAGEAGLLAAMGPAGWAIGGGLLLGSLMGWF